MSSSSFTQQVPGRAHSRANQAFTVVDPGISVADLQTAINDYTTVYLNPGVYDYSGLGSTPTITIPSGHSVIGVLLTPQVLTGPAQPAYTAAFGAVFLFGGTGSADVFRVTGFSRLENVILDFDDVDFSGLGTDAYAVESGRLSVVRRVIVARAGGADIGSGGAGAGSPRMGAFRATAEAVNDLCAVGWCSMGGAALVGTSSPSVGNLGLVDGLAVYDSTFNFTNQFQNILFGNFTLFRNCQIARCTHTSTSGNAISSHRAERGSVIENCSIEDMTYNTTSSARAFSAASGNVSRSTVIRQCFAGNNDYTLAAGGGEDFTLGESFGGSSLTENTLILDCVSEAPIAGDGFASTALSNGWADMIRGCQARLTPNGQNCFNLGASTGTRRSKIIDCYGDTSLGATLLAGGTSWHQVNLVSMT